MNFMMAGMAPVMSFLMMGRDMRAMDPLELLFWGVMSLGVLVGFITAYPSNVWMVGRGMKHGLMTERKHAAQAHDAHTHDEHAHGGGDHGGHGHGHGAGMRPDVTRPQIAAVAGVSTLFLLLGLVAPANWVNLRLSARDVGGMIATRPPRR